MAWPVQRLFSGLLEAYTRHILNPHDLSFCDATKMTYIMTGIRIPKVTLDAVTLPPRACAECARTAGGGDCFETSLGLGTACFLLLDITHLYLFEPRTSIDRSTPVTDWCADPDPFSTSAPGPAAGICGPLALLHARLHPRRPYDPGKRDAARLSESDAPRLDWCAAPDPFSTPAPGPTAGICGPLAMLHDRLHPRRSYDPGKRVATCLSESNAPRLELVSAEARATGQHTDWAAATGRPPGLHRRRLCCHVPRAEPCTALVLCPPPPLVRPPRWSLDHASP